MVIQVINTLDTDDTKFRQIDLNTDKIRGEIDAITSKYVDATTHPGPRQEDALSSDTEETIDGSIITRLIEYRDAKLRTFMTSVMHDDEVLAVTNDVDPSDVLHYELDLPVEFKDSQLKSLAILMHRYIVYGALYDFYADRGSNQANVYLLRLNGIQEDIKDAIRPVGYAKRPMQPFGPAGTMPL